MLAAGAGLREVAKKFNFSVSGVHRHSQKCFVEGATESDTELRQLQDAARRQLARCERSGDRRGVTDSLKILAEVRKRHQIASSVSVSPEQGAGNRKLSNAEFIERMKEIYHLGPKWDAAIANRTRPAPSDAELVEILRERVLSDGTRPEIAAVATRLASLILAVPLDRTTEKEVRQLEGGEYELGGMVESTEKLGVDAEEDDAKRAAAERVEGKSAAPSGD